jgi:hypothetical protein
MIKPFLVLSLLVSFSLGQKRTPAMYWESLEMKEKVAFVNGVHPQFHKSVQYSRAQPS